MVDRFLSRSRFSAKRIESSIELEHIDARLAEEAEKRLFDALLDQSTDRRRIDPARLCDAIDLKKGRLGA